MNDSEKITNGDEIPQKGKNLCPYSAKMKIVKYAENNDNKAAGRKYAVDEKRIRELRKNKNKIARLMNMKKEQLRKRLHGAAAKLLSENHEENIMDWIIFRQSKDLRVSRKLFMTKTLSAYQEAGGN